MPVLLTSSLQSRRLVHTVIANTFFPFKKDKHFPIFGGLLAEIDFALKGLLVEISFLVNGVLVLLTGQLIDAAATLEGLGFILTKFVGSLVK